MTCGSEYAPGLRAHGFRMTPQRMAILHVLHHSGAHLSPTEIYKKAHRGRAQPDGTDRLSHAGIFGKEWTGDFFPGG